MVQDRTTVTVTTVTVMD